jgi:hypothetical protein
MNHQPYENKKPFPVRIPFPPALTKFSAVDKNAEKYREAAAYVSFSGAKS